MIRGPGTSPQDPKRELSSLVQRLLEKKFPQLKKAPEECVYPVFLDVAGTYRQEEHGTLKVNAHNISLAIDMIKVLRNLLAKEKYEPHNGRIGIATPYAAQVRLYR